jgi:hypothetical protein
VDRHAAADDLEDAADVVAIFRKVTAPELEPGKLARPLIGRCAHHVPVIRARVTSLTSLMVERPLFAVGPADRLAIEESGL